MRFSLANAIALLIAGGSVVAALEMPLDIEVTKAVECERKSKSGMSLFLPLMLLPRYNSCLLFCSAVSCFCYSFCCYFSFASVFFLFELYQAQAYMYFVIVR